jgi:hypothetical protein
MAFRLARFGNAAVGESGRKQIQIAAQPTGKPGVRDPGVGYLGEDTAYGDESGHCRDVGKGECGLSVLSGTRKEVALVAEDVCPLGKELFQRRVVVMLAGSQRVSEVALFLLDAVGELIALNPHEPLCRQHWNKVPTYSPVDLSGTHLTRPGYLSSMVVLAAARPSDVAVIRGNNLPGTGAAEVNEIPGARDGKTGLVNHRERHEGDVVTISGNH